MKICAVMLAGGSGSRMNASVNKVLLPLCGIPVLIRSMTAFSYQVDEMALVCRREDENAVRDLLAQYAFPFRIVFARGGSTRQESVISGLQALSPDEEDLVLIHDAARCLVDPELISRVLCSVRECGTGIPGVPATSTFKVCTPDSFVDHTPERSALYEIQTPQGFRAGTILSALRRAGEEGVDCTDDAGVLEHYGIPVRVVPGSVRNFKLTQPSDMDRARAVLEKTVSAPSRIGMGYDVHRFAPDRKLILCGVDVPYDLGLLGHSDADVALHALMDAMLGACSLGDIGKHFPDTDDRYRGISSLELLSRTDSLLRESGYRVYNLDITIAAQKPKLLPFIPQMIENIALRLGIPASFVSVKATTTEGLGFEGRMEGISAYAVCSVVSGQDH